VGWALLLLRLIDGIGLVAEAVFVFGLGPRAGASEPVAGLVLGLGLTASAIVLILGLRTSLAASAGAACTLGSALYTIHYLAGMENWRDEWFFLYGLVFFLSGSLALMGPGGYSLEARLSGWKVIKLSSRKSHSEDAAVTRKPTECCLQESENRSNGRRERGNSMNSNMNTS